MLYKDICKILSLYLFGFAATLLIPLAVAVYFRFSEIYHPQEHSVHIFIETIFICLLLAAILGIIGLNSSGRLYRKEGLAAVVIIWFLTPAIAALPFYLSGVLSNPSQAYFEAASGLTTTGSTMMTAKKFDASGKEIPIETVVNGVMPTKYVFYGNIDPVIDPDTGKVLFTGIEAVGKALLFWRSFIQWLGGVGVIVLFVAILPLLGVGGKVLFHMEMPGPFKESLTPRVKETASLLWKIYVVLTVLQVLLLMVTNAKMDLFNALCISFSTLSTGGLSVLNDSMAGYHNAWTDWIVSFFMILGSINFAIYFYILKGKFYRAYEPEFFLFMAILTISCFFTAWYLVGTPKHLLGAPSEGVYSWSEAIRYGFFQIISSQTSTGFSVADYDFWPYPVQVLMVIVIFIGGMAGSTAGGTKVIRHYMSFRLIQNKIESLFRPDSVRQFRLAGKEVDTGASIMVLSFLVIYIFFSVLFTFFFVLDGIDPETSFGLVACFINNSGLSFRVAGPTGSSAFLSPLSSNLGSILMILGRLEFFAVLAVLVPAFWKQT